MSKIIYRPHRGSFKDAMAEARIFQNEDEMKSWIVSNSAEVFGMPMLDVSDIVIKDESLDDSRNGWHDTKYVCVKRYGSEVFSTPQCIGMCATDFPATEVN